MLNNNHIIAYYYNLYITLSEVTNPKERSAKQQQDINNAYINWRKETLNAGWL